MTHTMWWRGEPVNRKPYRMGRVHVPAPTTGYYPERLIAIDSRNIPVISPPQPRLDHHGLPIYRVKARRCPT